MAVKISGMPPSGTLHAADLVAIARVDDDTYQTDLSQLAAFVGDLAQSPPPAAPSHGIARFTSGDVLVVPVGVTTKYATAAGGGGGGGGHDGVTGGGGGAGGVSTFMQALTVVPGETLTIVVGFAGGAGGADGNGGSGGTTSVTGSVSGLLLSLQGGQGGQRGSLGGGGGGPSAAHQQIGTSAVGARPGDGGDTEAGGLGARVVTVPPGGSSGPSNGGGGYGGAPGIQGASVGAGGIVVLQW